MELFRLTFGETPIVAAAIHAGHAVRPGVANLLALDEPGRLREEDPYTDRLVDIVPTHVVGRRSRFELDLNRPREKAVYVTPADAWGLQVWRSDLPPEIVAESLAQYDAFYAHVRTVLQQTVAQHGAAVVLDLHSYNHRRGGPNAPADSPQDNPEVNIGVGSVDEPRWGLLVDRFVADLGRAEVGGKPLDVRQNVRFRGGFFPTWINANFPTTVCAIAVEFKKTFMDEWTGDLDSGALDGLRWALASTLPGLRQSLTELTASQTGRPGSASRAAH